MKPDIHPTYYPNATVSCSCGVSFEVGATMESISVEVCSACHPFYTGKQNLVDTAGRVDKFRQRTEKAAALKATKAAKAKKVAKTIEVPSEAEKLKEMRKSLLKEVA